MTELGKNSLIVSLFFQKMSKSTQGSQNNDNLQTQPANQKPPLELKRGKLEVVGYSRDDPMIIKLKVTLATGVEKAVCK